MPEEQKPQEISRRRFLTLDWESEEKNRYRGIKFEPAQHGIVKEQVKRWQPLLIHGDLNARGWDNTKTLESRLTQYHPQVIAIDGSSPHSTPLDRDSKISIWLNLPGDIRKIRPMDKSLYVVRGDISGILDYDILESISESSNLPKELKKEIRDFIKTKEAQADPLLKAGAFESLMGGSILAAMGALSRRDFLKILGIAVGGVFALRSPLLLYSEQLATDASNEELKEFFLDVAHWNRPLFIKDKYLDARTALLITKVEDTIDKLQMDKNTPGSIIFGFGHTREARALQINREYRQQTIRDVATELVNGIDQIFTKAGIGDLTRKQARNYILNHFSAVEVAKVQVPEEIEYKTGNPEKAFTLIDQMVQPVTFFRSPQVERAIDHLKA